MKESRIAGRTKFVSTMVFTMALAASACSSQAGPRGTPFAVTVRDFRITPQSTVLGGGPVVFLVHDRGPSTHEFIVAQTGLPPDGLPVRPDGLTIDERSPLAPRPVRALLQPRGPLSGRDACPHRSEKRCGSAVTWRAFASTGDSA